MWKSQDLAGKLDEQRRAVDDQNSPSRGAWGVGSAAVWGSDDV
jgi:hypothetical protein